MAEPAEHGVSPGRALPKGPVLDWASLRGPAAAGLPGLEQAPHRLYTTSGRAALYQALQQMKLPAGSVVLVPTYHCPTMVAPIVQAGHKPVFFAINANGLPALDAIAETVRRQARAIIVAHYFGIAQSLASVRAWCDANQILLIEDCAHCLFGQAGERLVGQWGDYATASLTKFLPVPEAGLLASYHHAVPAALPSQGAVAQIKGWVDTLERAHRADRLRGLGWLLGSLLALKNRGATRPQGPSVHQPVSAAQISVAQAVSDCDMSRTGLAPLALARWLIRWLPRSRIVARRQANGAQLREALAGMKGAHVLPGGHSPGAPYALPVWVNDAERVYQALRQQGIAVFRWDHCWPGTPKDPSDQGPLWSQHVLQLLVHQDLDSTDLARTASALRTLIEPVSEQADALRTP
jgi:selenocysteine lyase/cysteine desulfurase